MNEDLFHLTEDNEKQLGLKVPYLGAIGAIDVFGKLYKIRYVIFYEFTRKRHWSPKERSKYLLLARILICHFSNDSIEVDNKSYFFNS